MLLITIETLRYERDCLRKAREAPLIHKAKTIGPLGIKNATNYIHYVILTMYICNFRLLFYSSIYSVFLHRSEK